MALVIHMPEEIFEMCVGEIGRYLTWQIGKGNRKEVLDLTGYAGRVFFNYDGVAPHVKRAGVIDQVNGLLIYTFLGDELPTVGECFVQPMIKAPDWYGGNAPGRGSLETSGDMSTIRVLSRST